MNDRLTTFSGKVKIILLDLADQREVIIKDAAIKIKNGERLDLEKIFKSDLPASRDYIIVASLTDQKGNLVCRNFFAAKRWKHLKLPQSKIKIEVKDDRRINLRSNKPSFFVDLYHEQVTFSESGMIILANETVNLNMEVNKEQQLNVTDVKVYSLNNYV
jgi:hypothetical protein